MRLSAPCAWTFCSQADEGIYPMCGIVGYTGSDIAKNILVTGLKRMEYRGYDSSGVALEVGEGAAAHLDVIRRVGKVAGLESELSNIDSDATCGIGHTRWATHGKPSVVNAHPHTSCDGRIAIVHNGIIENFAELREELEGRGHHFKSETDTEVFAHLIEEAYAETHDLMASVREACTHVVGAYGLAAVCADEPGVIAVARKDSPIVVGVGETGSYVASDVIALIDATRDVVVLEDGQFAKLTPAGVEYTDEAGNVIEPKGTHIDWDLDMAEKGGYPDFMLKEIHEQPRVVRDTLVGRMTPAGELDIDELGLSLEELNDIDRVYVIACGTSYHAGLIAKNLIEGWARIPTEVEAASECRYRNPIITPTTLVVAVSQSGETADTLAAVELARKAGAFVFGICNVVGSSIARATDSGAYIHVGPEIGVASTKAFTGQVTVMAMLALAVGREKGTVTEEYYREVAKGLLELPAVLEDVLGLGDRIADLSKIFTYAHNFIYLGRGYNYPTALEGALKLKEISYIHAEGYPAAEMKHGAIALIDNEMPTVAIATPDNTYEKTASNIEEIRARGGKIIAVIARDDTHVRRSADYTIEVPVVTDCLMPIVVSVPLQLLAYYIAVNKGRNVDQPRNLAKSVTVE